MKPRSPLRLWLACMLLPLASGDTATHAAEPNTGVTLQVQVNLPAAHQPDPDPQFVAAFVARVRDAFAQQGYVGAIAEATPDRDLPNETAVLLRIDVTELRVRADEVDCRFTATVRTHAEELAVGRFRDRGLHWNREAGQLGPESRGRDSDPTMLRLYQAVAASRLLPGLAGS